MKNILSLFLLFPVFLWSQTNFEKGEKFFEQKKFVIAKSFLELNLKQNPNDLKTIEYLGDIQSNNKSWDNAVFYYEKLKKLKPTEADYYYKYGGALGMKAKESNKFAALGMIGNVKSSFEKAIALNPKHIQARWALIELYLQLPGIIGGSEKKATNYANELLQLSPVDGYLAKGYIAEYFQRFKEAELQYKKANEIGKSKITYQKLYDLYKNKLKQPAKAEALKNGV